MKKSKDIPEEIKDDIICFLSNKLTPEKANRLLRWLNENTDNKKFFDQITDIWHLSSSLDKTTEFDPVIAWEEITSRLKKPQKVNLPQQGTIWVRSWYKIASVAIILILSGILVLQNLNKNPDEQFVEMVAPRGSRSYVTLADGSKVWINSGSKITFPGSFGKSARKIELEGEAYFSVAKNKNIPFIVHVSELDITALGTEFNVKAYTDENIVETTLEKGSIKIEPTSKSGEFFSPLILKPNQKATYHKKTSSIDTEKPVKKEDSQPDPGSNSSIRKPEKKIEINSVEDTKPYTSWKENRWLFRHETLKDLAQKLERRYDVNICFKDDAIKNYTFSGSLYDESIEQVFEAIKIIAPINYKITHKNIEISTNKYLKEKYEKLNPL